MNNSKIFFAQNLRALLKSKRIKGVEIADRLGVSQSAVSGWTTGASYPHFQVLLKLAEILEVDLNTLVHEPVESMHESRTPYESRMERVEAKVAELDERLTRIEGSS